MTPLHYIALVALYLAAPVAITAAPYSAGERLDFKVYFGFILGGESSMSVESGDSSGGPPGLHLVSEAHSTRTVDTFYKVRDRVESWVDADSGFSRRYEKHLREGKYRDDKLVEYLPAGGRALLTRRDQAPESLDVAGRTYDVLAAFYKVRGMDLKVGESVFLDLHDIDKQYRLEIKVLRQETLQVPAGVFDCIVIEPRLLSSGLFRKEGEMQVWLTDDVRRMPVMMQSRLYFGRVWAKLIGYRLGN